MRITKLSTGSVELLLRRLASDRLNGPFVPGIVDATIALPGFIAYHDSTDGLHLIASPRPLHYVECLLGGTCKVYTWTESPADNGGPVERTLPCNSVGQALAVLIDTTLEEMAAAD